jgi:predicted nucleic acid-binding protein
VIVADTSLVSYLLIEGEQTEGARAVWSTDPDWRLPPLWRAEFLNVLVTSARAGVVDREQALLLWMRATALFGLGEVDPTGEDVLDVALQSGLYAYDAQFVSVAERLGVPLVTADKAILRARPDLARSITSYRAA